MICFLHLQNSSAFLFIGSCFSFTQVALFIKQTLHFLFFLILQDYQNRKLSSKELICIFRVPKTSWYWNLSVLGRLSTLELYLQPLLLLRYSFSRQKALWDSLYPLSFSCYSCFLKQALLSTPVQRYCSQTSHNLNNLSVTTQAVCGRDGIWTLSNSKANYLRKWSTGLGEEGPFNRN